MAIDREDTLKKAEKLLRQGRLDAAIAEYRRVVEDQPRDWTTANTLGDLYVRAGQPDTGRRALHPHRRPLRRRRLLPEGRRALQEDPQDHPRRRDDAAAARRDSRPGRGCSPTRKSHLNAVATRRRARGDRRGAAEIVVRLGIVDPADFDARIAAARTLDEMGDEARPRARFKALHDDLLEKGRTAEALAALRGVRGSIPHDRRCARHRWRRPRWTPGTSTARASFSIARRAGNDPALLIALAEIELRAGRRRSRARDACRALLAAIPRQRSTVVELGVVDARDATARRRSSASTPASTRRSAAPTFDEARVAMLQEFVTRVPGHIPALLKLVEVCVDGGLESAMYEAQEQLTDAYLAAGQAAEARVIAEDLVAREPWEAVAHRSFPPCPGHAAGVGSGYA